MNRFLNGVPRQYVWALLVLNYLLSTKPVSAQWRRADLPLHSFGDISVPSQIFGIRFLDDVGAPQIGFACGNALYRTSDGGWTWKVIDNENNYVNSDFSFKDITTGWMTWTGQQGGGVSKTTDGGETWRKLSLAGTRGGIGPPYGLYYSQTSKILASGGAWNRGWTYRSTDEGETWEWMAPEPHLSFAFTSADSGVFCSIWGVGTKPAQGFTKWLITTNGSRTWQEIPIDSSAWQPLAIPHSKTYFSLTPHGNFLRTDDNWSTWRLVHTFPLHDYGPLAGEFWQNSSVVRGSLDSLFVRTTRGVEFSTDEGVSWVSLCGPRSDEPKYQTFYVVSRTVFCSNPWTPGNGYLWRLNLDSLDIPSDVSCRFRGEKKTVALDASRDVRVICRTIDRAADSARVRIRYDEEAFKYSRAEIPGGWTAREMQEPGVIDLSVAKGPNGSASDTTFDIVFATFVSKPTADLVVEAQKVFSYDFDASCIAGKAERPDTLTVLFNDCESTRLLDLMNDVRMQERGILEIRNLAQNHDQIQIDIQSYRDIPVSLELFDVLGKTLISRPLNGLSDRVTIAGLQAGSYFLRLRQGREVVTRKIKIE